MIFFSFLNEYSKIIIFFLISITLCYILILVSYLLSLNSKKDNEKLSEYECGFEPFDSATRLPFDIHFYVIGILFLIFDMEIAFIFPWIIDFLVLSWFGIYSFLLFIILLTIGFIYEWTRGALSWTSASA